MQSDEAVRAGATAGRTGYQALLEAAKRREFDILLVEEVSRFSRDFLGGITQLAELKALGVQLADTKSGLIDLNSAEGQLKIAFNLVSSQQEPQRLGERSKRGLKGKILDHYSAGGQAAYGLQRVPIYSDSQVDVDGRPKRVGVRFEPHPAEALIVRRIFEQYRDGWSKHAIARRLNEEGIPTRRAGRTHDGRPTSGTWTAAGVRAILMNKLYVGERIWNRTSRVGEKSARSGKKLQKANAPTDWVTVKDYTTAIIDEELWTAVERRLRSDGEKYQRHHVANQNKQYLLSGLLRCANCGGNFVIGAHQGRPRVPHYRCSYRASRGKVVCTNAVAVSQPALEKRVRQTLDVIVKDPQKLTALVAEHNKRINQANETQFAVVRALETRRRGLEEQRDRLVDAIKLGTGAAKVLVAELEKCTAEIEQLTERAASAEALVQPLLFPKPAAVADYTSGSTSLFAGDFMADKQFVDRVVEAVFIYADGSIVLQFRETSLFEPVREVRLRRAADAPEEQADLATARRQARQEFQETRGAYLKAAPERAAEMVVHVEQDADGNPAFIAFTQGAVQVTRAPGNDGRLAAQPPAGREMNRKKALASPAGFEPA